MTRTGLFRSRTPEPEEDAKPTTVNSGRGGGGAAMRVIVPLQGVVQGRGGLFLGSVIPCALFYFLQLYFKRHRDNPNEPDGPNSHNPKAPSPLESAGQLMELSGFARTYSRNLLSPRSPSGPAYVSGRANCIVKGGDSPYYIGLRKVSDDPYDELDNPNGVIQLGLAENRVSLP